MDTGINVLVITVNYRSWEASLHFIESIRKVDGFNDAALVIVDNHSGDESAGILRDSVAGLANVSVLESPSNSGYFGAAKWALQQYLQTNPLPSWTIVCNNDVVFTDRAFFSNLLRHDYMSAGVLAPAVLDESASRDSNPFMMERPRRLRVAELRFWMGHYYLASAHEFLSTLKKMWSAKFSLPRAAPSANAGARAIYAPHGSFIIFSELFFKKGGAIDGDFFLYAEEISVAETCRQLGVHVIYDPHLVVMHRNHGTRGKRFTRKIYQYQKDGFRYLSAKYLADVSSLF